MNNFRLFNTISHTFKEIPHNLKGKSKSSQEWLIRQLKDPYVEKARAQNYRCRSAFKLLEIDERMGIFSPGQCVIDCGAAPGSWSQVAVEKTNADGRSKNKPEGLVVGLDLLPIYPIEGALLFGNCDFSQGKCRQRVKEALSGRAADVVLSDMAPNAAGVKSMDHEAIVGLAYLFVRFAMEVSGVGASLVCKLWDGGGTPKLEADLSRFYGSVKRMKPRASRTDSSELFLVAKQFKGVVQNKKSVPS